MKLTKEKTSLILFPTSHYGTYDHFAIVNVNKLVKTLESLKPIVPVLSTPNLMSLHYHMDTNIFEAYDDARQVIKDWETLAFEKDKYCYVIVQKKQLLLSKNMSVKPILPVLL